MSSSKSNLHPHAEHDAETAEFAAAHGNFWKMQDLLYENQENLEDESLFGFAAKLGLSPNKLRRSLGAGIYQDRIDKGLSRRSAFGSKRNACFLHQRFALRRFL
jgi:protein-disulfide isomerase